MKLKMDQGAAWALGIVLSGAVFGTGYGLTRWAAASQGHGRADLHHASDHGAGATAHEGGGHEAAGHEAASHEAASHEAAGHEAAGHGSPAASSHGKKHSESPVWSYQGASGPEHWGSLSADFALCSKGKQQSPVDVDETVAGGKLLPLKFHYKPVDLVLKNDGRTIQGDAASGNYVEIEGERYDLAEFHFHVPSEHKVAGAPYDLELHLVHKNAHGDLAKVAVLFEEGSANQGLQALWKVLPDQVGSHAETFPFNPESLLPGRRVYFHYMGSQTRPPCHEGVRWYVLTQPLEVSSKQVDELTRLVTHNARPVQPLGSRKILRSAR